MKSAELLPFPFHYVPRQLKFIVDYSKAKRQFTLEVQQRLFENLPFRPCPIFLTSPGDPENTILRGRVKLNDIEILSENEPMTWNTREFQNLIHEKLG